MKQDDKEFRAVIHNEQGSGENYDQLSDCGLNQIESTAKNDELKDNESEKQLKNRKRRSYTLFFKLKVLKDLKEVLHSTAIKDKYKFIAEKHQINKSLVCKWKKSEKVLQEEADLMRTKKKRKGIESTSTARTSRRITRKFKLQHFPVAEKKLVEEFRKRRASGFKVGHKWLKIKMKQMIRTFYGDSIADKFKGSQNWLRRFVARNGISLRRKTNKKKTGNDTRLSIIQKFHQQLRKDLNSKRRREEVTEFTTKWGRWKPKRRFNVDQMPCPFIIDQDRTYDEKGSSNVWVSQLGNGLDKRQFTLQLCICPTDFQPIPPAIIFRGKGKRVKDSELQAYDSRVHIYWQENAWLDSRVALEWVENTFAPAIDKTAENVLFLDNLAS